MTIAVEDLKTDWAEDIDTPVKENNFTSLNSYNSCIRNVQNEPQPLQEEAFHGLAGQIIKKIEPHTEADPAALLMQFFVAFGNSIGRHRYFKIEATQHYPVLFVVVVGQSSKARKGTSLNQIKHIFREVEVDMNWFKEQIISGLSTGEGLISQVRDPLGDDAGISDKRLLVIESEFGRILKTMQRKENILSVILREAWDGNDLRIVTKQSPLRATAPHVSVIAHITVEELKSLIRPEDAFNGFANRFLWVFAKRSKRLPEGGKIDHEDFSKEYDILKMAFEFGKQEGELQFSVDAKILWNDLYEELSEEAHGAVGAITSRSESQVRRMAMLYAILDCSDCVDTPHLKAGNALWQYCEDSVYHIFGDKIFSKHEQRIFNALQNHPQGMTKTDLHRAFHNNLGAAEIDQAIKGLVEKGKIQPVVGLKAGVDVWTIL
jgi:hypothetical protein